MSKITLRIPTKDQYAFIERVYDDEREDVTPEGIKVSYDKLYNAMNGYGDNNFLDDLIIIVKNNLRIEGEDNLEQYQGFSDKQKLVLKEIKNLVSRAISKYKPEK